VQQARQIFDAIGRSLIVDEKHMDAVTGLSASGPAFVYTIIESFIEGGVKVGLPRDVATLLAAQMVHGAANMVLETGEHPAKLKDIVTTPAGCTVDGLLELEDGGLRVKGRLSLMPKSAAWPTCWGPCRRNSINSVLQSASSSPVTGQSICRGSDSTPTPCLAA
jgi:hypothetical protein